MEKKAYIWVRREDFDKIVGHLFRKKIGKKYIVVLIVFLLTADIENNKIIFSKRLL